MRRPASPWNTVLAVSVGCAAALLATGFGREVALSGQEVQLDADPAVVLRRLRETLGAGEDVIAAEPRRIVRRFSGSAGGFLYATVELVELDDHGISV